MSYMTKGNMSHDELVKKVSEGIVNLGYGRLMTEEEMERNEKNRRKRAKRNAFKESVLSCVRTIVYTPLSIAFHAVSFVTRGVGFVSAFGMLVGCYHIYEGISEVMGGAAFRNVDSFEKAIPFFVVPFVAYGVSEVTDRLYRYFEDNAF